MNGTNLNLFSSYLNNRKRYTEIDHIKSNNNYWYTTGLNARTSVIYYIYINDFEQTSKMFNFIIYADDTSLSSTFHTFNDNIHNDNLQYLINYKVLKIN